MEDLVCDFEVDDFEVEDDIELYETVMNENISLVRTSKFYVFN